ncbi:hypothetical protein GGR56DRAFT_460396 [Xylariaceae sp. FL0804]|nr:hypothetical protein GGR56DRAFT_460396 [Xylariaceae sp. FL0804]
MRGGPGRCLLLRPLNGAIGMRDELRHTRCARAHVCAVPVCCRVPCIYSRSCCLVLSPGTKQLGRKAAWQVCLRHCWYRNPADRFGDVRGRVSRAGRSRRDEPRRTEDRYCRHMPLPRSIHTQKGREREPPKATARGVVPLSERPAGSGQLVARQGARGRSDSEHVAPCQIAGLTHQTHTHTGAHTRQDMPMIPPASAPPAVHRNQGKYFSSALGDRRGPLNPPVATPSSRDFPWPGRRPTRETESVGGLSTWLRPSSDPSIHSSDKGGKKKLKKKKKRAYQNTDRVFTPSAASSRPVPVWRLQLPDLALWWVAASARLGACTYA